MDEELKSYLQAMENRTSANMQAMEDRTAAKMQAMENRTSANMQAMEDRTAQLIAAELGSLHTEIKDSESRLTVRLDSISARLSLQAGLIQAGARAMARFSAFSENSEERWVDLMGRVATVEDRLKKHLDGK